MHTIYIKTHNKTGLKYLGWTQETDPTKYQGSGTYWKSHIKKHGYDVSTEIVCQTELYMVALITAMECNEKWDPKNNEEFANLQDEDLNTGLRSASTRELMSLAKLGKKRPPRTPEHRAHHAASLKGKKYKKGKIRTRKPIRQRLERGSARVSCE